VELKTLSREIKKSTRNKQYFNITGDGLYKYIYIINWVKNLSLLNSSQENF